LVDLLRRCVFILRSGDVIATREVSIATRDVHGPSRLALISPSGVELARRSVDSVRKSLDSASDSLDVARELFDSATRGVFFVPRSFDSATGSVDSMRG
jgi:hypothetical protein